MTKTEYLVPREKVAKAFAYQRRCNSTRALPEVLISVVDGASGELLDLRWVKRCPKHCYVRAIVVPGRRAYLNFTVTRKISEK